MEKEEITKYVVNALGRHRSRNDIVQYLCENAGMTWPDAEKLVKQIEVRHGSEIHARQSPLIIALGIFSILGGIALIGYGAFYFLGYIRLGFAADHTVRAGTRYLEEAKFAIGALITGMGMITGALVGMWKTIQDFFEHKNNR